MRVVTPFRPFPAESQAHQQLGPFDWIGAIQMLSASVERSCGCETVTLTDVDTELPVPTFKFVTAERRLMLWILEVSRAYLASDRFDQDTVMVSPDMLVYQPLAPHFTADLGILVRAGKFTEHRPVLNSVQWWSHAAKDRLVAWYDRAIDFARGLSDDLIQWGADTEPFVGLLAPIDREVIGLRGDLRVAFLPCESIVTPLMTGDVNALQYGLSLKPTTAVVDFRYGRKQWMADYFNATMGSAVTR